MSRPQTRRSPAATGLRDRTHNTSNCNPSTAINPLQRIRDWNRERRIRRLSAQFLDAYRAGNKVSARGIDAARLAEIRSRSSEQIERMESNLATRIRRVVKVFTMDAFLHRHIPASLVTALFRVLRLRGA
jgi:hypothetical protein